VHTLALALAWLVAVAAMVVLGDAAIGARRLRHLARLPPLDTGPAVSVIVAARNEAHGIEAGVRSLLRLSYPALEIIVVNDRSTDDTGAILERIRREDPRLTVITIESLPPGWLGKNHALAVGAAHARGELLVFTDADVVFEPTTIGRAVRLLEDERLDFLAAIPDVVVNGLALRALVMTFGVLFGIYTRPWKARDPRSRQHIGIGAFNMVRASAYRRAGTHAAIALRPDDDLRLARLVKDAGFVQDVAQARELIAVEWYPSVPAMVHGLMKNAFAGINYSVMALLGTTLALLLFNVWPWVAVLTSRGVACTLWGVAVAALMLLGLGHTKTTRISPFYVLLYPFGVLGFIFILWRSAWLALSRGAVEWRDTSYPLRALRHAAPAPPVDRTI
jgi:glycosyltransferase involved in cell wall biosynthesis